MNCARCVGQPTYLAGPWGPAGNPGAPVFLLAQNPPRNLVQARPGAFRLHGPRETPPGRLEQAVDPLVAALGGPRAVYATQVVKCATRDNSVPGALLAACADHLSAEVSASGAGLFVLLGKYAAAAFRRFEHRSRPLGAAPLPVRAGVTQSYAVELRRTVLFDGRRVLTLTLPHPAVATRFVLPGAWPAAAVSLLAQHAPAARWRL